MPHPGWEDLSTFFDPDEFATLALFTRDAETVAEVLGIFEDANQVAALGDYDLEHPTPRFLCPETSVAGVRKNDRVTIEGKEFDLMRDPELDGTGLATLILAEPNVIYNAGL